MKFLLTIYICSIINGECISPKLEQFKMDTFYKTHYDCVRSGLGNSFEILFDSNTFPQDVVNQMELYPKFSCEKIIVVPPPKPKLVEPGTPS
jgi:hypothetical protein